MLAKILIVTGTGRSGTTYMFDLLRRVYGIGHGIRLSAEPNDVLNICRFAAKRNLENETALDEVIQRMGESRIIRYEIMNENINAIDGNHVKSLITERSVEGLMIAFFRYVADIRGADPKFPAFKHPMVLQNILEFYHYFPNACFINMIRRGEDVAGSTLKFSWGATNGIAGVLEWRKRLLKAFNDFNEIAPERVLHLRLEDARFNQHLFVQNLDHFIYLNHGITKSQDLEKELNENFKELKPYQYSGVIGFLVHKLAINLNHRIGYPVKKIPEWQFRLFQFVSMPFLLIDYSIRGFRRIIKNISTSKSKN